MHFYSIPPDNLLLSTPQERGNYSSPWPHFFKKYTPPSSIKGEKKYETKYSSIPVWEKVFKNEPSQTWGRQLLKILSEMIWQPHPPKTRGSHYVHILLTSTVFLPSLDFGQISFVNSKSIHGAQGRLLPQFWLNTGHYLLSKFSRLDNRETVQTMKNKISFF